MTETSLTSQDEQTIQTAAHGVVSLMASADPGAISSTKAGIAGGKAMSSATGLVGHLLAKKPTKLDLKGTVAQQADTVLPALTRSMEILAAKAPTRSTTSDAPSTPSCNPPRTQEATDPTLPKPR